jgi:hypothetical protein
MLCQLRTEKVTFTVFGWFHIYCFLGKDSHYARGCGLLFCVIAVDMKSIVRFSALLCDSCLTSFVCENTKLTMLIQKGINYNSRVFITMLLVLLSIIKLVNLLIDLGGSAI